MFTRINGAVTVSAIGKVPIAYLIRTDTNQIAVLDLNTQNVSPDFFAYRTHPVGDREKLRRLKRVTWYGTGQITTGQLWITAGNSITETYPISLDTANPTQGILCVQYTTGLKGYYFDSTILAQGVGVIINTVKYEYIDVN